MFKGFERCDAEHQWFDIIVSDRTLFFEYSLTVYLQIFALLYENSVTYSGVCYKTKKTIPCFNSKLQSAVVWETTSDCYVHIVLLFNMVTETV